MPLYADKQSALLFFVLAACVLQNKKRKKPEPTDHKMYKSVFPASRTCCMGFNMRGGGVVVISMY